jgi:hypothetical protein
LHEHINVGSSPAAVEGFPRLRDARPGGCESNASKVYDGRSVAFQKHFSNAVYVR